MQVALLAAAITVEAVEAGQDGDVLGTIGCTVEALAALAAMLPEIGVDVPPTLRTAIALLAELAGDVCPAPPEPEPDGDETTEARFFAVDRLPDMPRNYAERIEMVLADRVETILGRP